MKGVGKRDERTNRRVHRRMRVPYLPMNDTVDGRAACLAILVCCDVDVEAETKKVASCKSEKTCNR